MGMWVEMCVRVKEVCLGEDWQYVRFECSRAYPWASRRQ